MAAKKKTRKKQTRAKKSVLNKTKPAKNVAKRKTTSAKKSAKKKSVNPKATSRKSSKRSKGRPRTYGSLDNVVAITTESRRARAGGQSGDLQGLTNSAASNSESVDELLEEGNTFEAEAVAGVEHADDAEEQEVHTHEVPEDDVPGEYLEKD